MEPGDTSDYDGVAGSHCIVRDTASSVIRSEQSSLPALASRGERGSAIPTGSTIIITGKKVGIGWDSESAFVAHVVMHQYGNGPCPPPPRLSDSGLVAKLTTVTQKIEFGMCEAGW